MKFALVFAVGLCLLFTTMPTLADQAADAAAIRKAREKRIESYNTKSSHGSSIRRGLCEEERQMAGS